MAALTSTLLFKSAIAWAIHTSPQGKKLYRDAILTVNRVLLEQQTIMRQFSLSLSLPCLERVSE